MAEQLKAIAPSVRKLVSGGDQAFEVAAELRIFHVPVDHASASGNGRRGHISGGPTMPIETAVVRVWCQKSQVFVVTATTTRGHVIGQVRANTYKQALTILREQIETP